VKKFILLLAMFAFTGTALFAQDDELPPPTSKPKTDNNSPVPPAGNTTTNTPDNNGFQGFSKSKKLDLSKFIIEPDFNLGFSSNEID
jgi:hypothetical protein